MAIHPNRIAALPSGCAVEPSSEGHASVLVVEDDPAIRRLLVALLSSAGYAVHAVTDGQEALAFSATARLGAVFLDVTLPEVSGWDVLARLRAAGDAPPVVLLTADASAVCRARTEGAAAAILKPFDIDEVLDLAAQLLGRQ